jgi:hypothetical protein
MNVPNLKDRFVKVRAYLTDEGFGYTHWRAAQFSPPTLPDTRYAVLVICESKSDRDAVFQRLKE